jgi:hypothetical protein
MPPQWHAATTTTLTPSGVVRNPAMALIDTQQTMDAYFRDLLNRGDYSRHYSDDVVIEVRGTDQRYQGREAAKNWVEGIHAVGQIKVRNTFMGETHAVAEASSSVRMESRCPTR